MVANFDELLNGSIEFRLEEVAVVTQERLEIEVTPPTMEEVQLAVKKLKNNKAPGLDLIQGELLKNAGTVYLKHLQQLMIGYGMKKSFQKNMSVIRPIHKKGDILDCANYRRTLSTAYREFSNIFFSTHNKIWATLCIYNSFCSGLQNLC